MSSHNKMFYMGLMVLMLTTSLFGSLWTPQALAETQSVSDPFAPNLINELKAMGIAVEKVRKTGEQAVGFKRFNAQGQTVELKALLKKGPVVLTFYRGNWCPYCNAAMRELSAAWPAIKKEGATLVAISPQTLAKTQEMQQKYQLEFEVLSDPNNQVARSYGLVYQVPADYLARLRLLFVELKKFNGSETPELPLTATYIILPNGTIAYHFIDPNYRERAKPEILLQVLKKLK